jgi:hypothetical protein
MRLREEKDKENDERREHGFTSEIFQNTGNQRGPQARPSGGSF